MNLQDNLSYKQGLSAELIAAALLVQEGWRVAIPLTYMNPYDLILDAGGRLLKVQVKRGYFIPQRVRKAGKGDRAHYRASLQDHKRPASSRYTTTSFDILALVCTPTLVYFIPMHKLVGPNGQVLRQISVKLEDTTHRLDATAATERWAPYVNSCAAALVVSP